MYTADLSDGSALPDFMTFNANASGDKFTLIVNNSTPLTYNVRVTAYVNDKVSTLKSEAYVHTFKLFTATGISFTYATQSAEFYVG